MRTATALLWVTLLISATAASQTLPVYLRPAHDVPDTSAARRAEEVFQAYLHKRFEALGLRILESDTGRAFEVNFSVVPTGGDTYDIASVLTFRTCHVPGLRGGCSRGIPFDWMQLHGYTDLEEAARVIAESVYTELRAYQTLKHAIDSARSRKP